MLTADCSQLVHSMKYSIKVDRYLSDLKPELISSLTCTSLTLMRVTLKGYRPAPYTAQLECKEGVD